MKFIADFHVHSRFSIATAANSDLENFYTAAQLKGIKVVGTGDFTHPGWFSEIKEKLIPSEQGLYSLRPEIAKQCDTEIPVKCRNSVRFMLVTEISNIYKKDGRVRKNHNLVFVPDIERAEKLLKKLEKIGNIHSDGRPILGLDAKDLLDIVLNNSEQSFLVPAHIWTPWFSIFGSKSGFDALEECFEDLTSNIFAVETGLSSDPPMNWSVGRLEGLTLISNSDAHSPMKLGREANLLNTELSYAGIYKAMVSGNPEQFCGTYEFYPEEGKYHLDGHRKCSVRLEPEQTIEADGVCPKCGKALTKGVLHRVMELSDRKSKDPPKKAKPYFSTVQLIDIVSEIIGFGQGSKKVQAVYRKALELLGNEFAILHQIKRDHIEKTRIPLLGEAVERMRDGKVFLSAGFDGEYGQVKMFRPEERIRLSDQKHLFSIPDGPHPDNKKEYRLLEGKKTEQDLSESDRKRIGKPVSENHINFTLNKKQKEAVDCDAGRILIVAGPGTGKTRTLSHRIANLIQDKAVSPEKILAVTFTQKAAREMLLRLGSLLSNRSVLPRVGTFHSICLGILKVEKETSFQVIDESDRLALLKEAKRMYEMGSEKTGIRITEISDWISWIKQKEDFFIKPSTDRETILQVFENYRQLLENQNLMDYDDLIVETLALFEKDPDLMQMYRQKWSYLFVDEYQDLNKVQYLLVKKLAAPSDPESKIFAIGDPNQAIYGFRGASAEYFKRFSEDYPRSAQIRLDRNYRSTQTILKASGQILSATGSSGEIDVSSDIAEHENVMIVETETDRAEAVAIGRIIENLVGGTGFHSFDFSKLNDEADTGKYSFGDFAVLFRTRQQAEILMDCFTKAGIPYQFASKENVFYEKGVLELISMLKMVEGFGSILDLERVLKLKKMKMPSKSWKAFKNWCFEKKLTVSEAMEAAFRIPIPKVEKTAQGAFCQAFSEVKELRKKTGNLTVRQKIEYFVEKTNIYQQSQQDSEREGFLDLLENLLDASESRTEAFLEQAVFFNDTDFLVQAAQKVALMTMHASKGLEFPVVIISGCEEGLIPYAGTGNQVTDPEEERRLFYVAMTRAQERLYLTWARKRQQYKKTNLRQCSPFIKEIGSDIKERIIQNRATRKPDPQQQLSLF